MKAEIAAPEMMHRPEASSASIASRAPPEPEPIMEFPKLPSQRPRTTPTVKAKPKLQVENADIARPTDDVKEFSRSEMNPAAGAAAVAEAKPPAPTAAAAMPSSPIHHNKNHHTSVRKRMLAHLDHVYRTWVVATRETIQ